MTLPIGVFFRPSEFSCHDGTAYPDRWGDRLHILIAMLDRIRGEFGKPLKVVSGYRTPAYNVRIGGARFSQHVEGRAADIAPMEPNKIRLGAEVDRLHAVIERLLDRAQLPAVGGVGYYPASGWMHVDTRLRIPTTDGTMGRVARWTGTGTGSEVTG